jgi:hypothetical protein
MTENAAAGYGSRPPGLSFAGQQQALPISWHEIWQNTSLNLAGTIYFYIGM